MKSAASDLSHGAVLLRAACRAPSSQAGLARRLKVQRIRIHDLISGRCRMPRLDLAVKLWKGCAISLDSWLVAHVATANAAPAIRSDMTNVEIAAAIEPLVSKLRSKDARVVADTKEQMRALLEQLPDEETGDDAGREPWKGAGRSGTDGWQNQRDGGSEPQPRSGPLQALSSMGRPRAAPRPGFGFSRDETGALHSPRASDRTPGRGR